MPDCPGVDQCAELREARAALPQFISKFGMATTCRRCNAEAWVFIVSDGAPVRFGRGVRVVLVEADGKEHKCPK